MLLEEILIEWYKSEVERDLKFEETIKKLTRQ